MGQAGTLALWFWGIGQATAIGLATWGLLVMGTRLVPAARARIAICALWLMVCAPVLMLLPVGAIRLGSTFSSAGKTGDAVPAAAQPSAAVEEGTAADWNQMLLSAADWLVIAVEETNDTLAPAPSDWSWATWVLGWIVGCIAYGCLRIMGGVWQIHSLRAQAQPCTDRRLLTLGAECAAALELKTSVHWLQHSAIGSPAVVGLLRPAIILPEECCRWNDGQLKCAFAHELAHIKRHDVLATLLAQMALVLNYFHPVGHLLIGRMRLDQELAADCLAAPLVGGQQVYLETLASLALQRPYVRTGGPALAFLPTRRTFVRRLEMLRNLRLASTQATHWQATVLPMCILCLAFIAMFVRPTLAQKPSGGQSQSSSTAAPDAQSGTRPTAANPEQAASAPAADAVPDLLNYLPDPATVGVLMVDIEKLLQTEPFATMVAQLPPDQRTINPPFGKVNIDDVERVMVIISGLNPQRDASLVIRFKPGKTVPQSVKPEELANKSYGFVPPLATLDARTVLIGSKPDEMKPLLLLALASGDRGDLKKLIRRHPENAIQAALRVSALRPAIEPNAAKLGFLGPLWRDVTTASMGLQVGERVEIQITLDSPLPTAVRETLEAVKTLGRNALNSPFEASPQSRSAGQNLMLLHMARDIGNSALDNLVITEQAGAVQVATHWEQPAPALLNMMLPAVKNAREASRRTQDMNALKLIALALHNYHDAYGHFPPAIVTENGVDRSWRVELLPFLEQVDLYKQYRKDEPWDSPNNKRLGMTQIPAYAPSVVSTSAPLDPSLTPIRGIGGNRGILGRVERKLVDITDGTSNTLMVVNVRDMVPWTKPEEYAPTPEELIKAAQHENGFLGAFGDGAVRFISSSVDRYHLNALMTINGGEAVP